MSRLCLSGSAVTGLDSTTGKVFSLSSVQVGGQLSLHLHLMPGAHCKRPWGGQPASSDADTDHVYQHIPGPRCSVPWQTSAGQRGGLREDCAPQPLGEVAALESQGPCASSCCSPPALHPQCCGPRPRLSFVFPASCSAAQAAGADSNPRAPYQLPSAYVRGEKGLQALPGLHQPGCGLRLLLTKTLQTERLHLPPWLHLTAKAARHLQGAWITPQKSSQMGRSA